MMIFLKTSTRAGGFTTTFVAFKVDGGPAKSETFELSEEKSLVPWLTQRVTAMAHGQRATLISEPNSLTNPFTKGWIKKWKTEGFRGRPDWKTLDEVIEHLGIQLDFMGWCEEHAVIKKELEREIAIASGENPKEGPYVPSPGDPDDNPWAKPENVDDLIERAVAKDDLRDARRAHSPKAARQHSPRKTKR